jgi:hypothetical protein
MPTSDTGLFGRPVVLQRVIDIAPCDRRLAYQPPTQVRGCSIRARIRMRAPVLPMGSEVFPAGAFFLLDEAL